MNWSKDGIAGLKEFSLNEPHLCIIDIMMPKKDGFTLIQEIKEINSKVPVIFLTARSMEEDRVRGFELGADDYVTKPFSNAEFILRVEAVLKRCYEQAEVHGNDEIIIGVKFYCSLILSSSYMKSIFERMIEEKNEKHLIYKIMPRRSTPH